MTESTAPVPLALAPPTPDEVARFERDGFLTLGPMLGPEELAHYGEAVDAAVASRSLHDHRKLEEKTRYEQSFQQCLNLWEDHPRVRALSFHPHIARAAAALLGVPAVRLWHDQALYKDAGGRVTDPHQDQPYWAIEEPLTITAWIPFQDVGLENGALGFLPGSHRLGFRKFANIFSDTGLDLAAHPQLAALDTVYEAVPAGHVSFHHGLTVHRALPNLSEAPRRVHTVIFFAAGCTRRLRDHPHPSVDRSGIEPGAPIESTLTPIAWPREEAALPEPPPPPTPPTPGWPGWPPRRAESSGGA